LPPKLQPPPPPPSSSSSSSSSSPILDQESAYAKRTDHNDQDSDMESLDYESDDQNSVDGFIQSFIHTLKTRSSSPPPPPLLSSMEPCSTKQSVESSKAVPCVKFSQSLQEKLSAPTKKSTATKQKKTIPRYMMPARTPSFQEMLRKR
jgi:hypothetical protein